MEHNTSSYSRSLMRRRQAAQTRNMIQNGKQNFLVWEPIYFATSITDRKGGGEKKKN